MITSGEEPKTGQEVFATPINHKKIRCVLILGSGAIKIGEAGEFDYSGSQAIKALKEEGIRTILVNPNIATIQTDPNFADAVYSVPVLPEYVEEVIKKELPDGIILGFGGQTALNCGVKLHQLGILDKYGVKVLGTNIRAIELADDRRLFKKTMDEHGIPVPKSEAVHSVEDALKAAEGLGYPAMIRVAYNLGGKGSGVARNPEELKKIVSKGLINSMIHQVLVEEYLGDWKQVEFEVVRDAADNCIAVAMLENVLGMRVHTGDNVVVAPSQTLTNHEYHSIRIAAFDVVRAMGIIGECNVQFAIDSKSEKWRVIEVNSRLSRSSALASKATGYPLAYIAAKLAIGYTLPELKNKVTGITTACFEPALDYIIVKMPRFNFSKFDRVERKLGTCMRSVGEVMAVGCCFEEAIQKAVRMLDVDRDGLVSDEMPLETLEERLQNPTDKIIFDITGALRAGWSPERVAELSKVDPWYIHKIKNIIELEKSIELNLESIRKGKELGFSDSRLAQLLNTTEEEIREFRKQNNIIPAVRQIDTLAAEWPAKTNYLYFTYGGSKLDIDLTSKLKALVLGAGTYRIGSSVEFDWCTMNTVFALKKYVEEVIVLNNNPETVSTDYDMSDKLYLDELSFERVMDLIELEKPHGVVVSVGGQIPNSLALRLARSGVRLLGTDARSIDKAEDRSKFSSLLDKLGISQPPWCTAHSVSEVKEFARIIGYPLLIRPSYVLSGRAMKVVYSDGELEQFLRKAQVKVGTSIVASKFIQGAREVEIDAVSDGENVFIGQIVEHIEDAGVHSGDACMVIPSFSISNEVKSIITEYTSAIAHELHIKGPFNIQFLVKDGKVSVIECNLRSSRSMPFVSKTIGVNLMKLAVKAMFDQDVPFALGLPQAWGVKVPQFSFSRLDGADPSTGVEMRSTGEVACFAEDPESAFYGAWVAAENLIKNNSVYINFNSDVGPVMSQFQKLGYNILDTEDIKDIGLALVSPDNGLYTIRRKAADFNIPLLTDLKTTNFLLKALREHGSVVFQLKQYN